jgi:hypothetical protein
MFTGLGQAVRQNKVRSTFGASLWRIGNRLIPSQRLQDFAHATIDALHHRRIVGTRSAAWRWIAYGIIGSLSRAVWGVEGDVDKERPCRILVDELDGPARDEIRHVAVLFDGRVIFPEIRLPADELCAFARANGDMRVVVDSRALVAEEQVEAVSFFFISSGSECAKGGNPPSEPGRPGAGNTNSTP